MAGLDTLIRGAAIGVAAAAAFILWRALATLFQQWR
jgi:hypothetical protein